MRYAVAALLLAMALENGMADNKPDFSKFSQGTIHPETGMRVGASSESDYLAAGLMPLGNQKAFDSLPSNFQGLGSDPLQVARARAGLAPDAGNVVTGPDGLLYLYSGGEPISLTDQQFTNRPQGAGSLLKEATIGGGAPGLGVLAPALAGAGLSAFGVTDPFISNAVSGGVKSLLSGGNPLTGAATGGAFGELLSNVGGAPDASSGVNPQDGVGPIYLDEVGFEGGGGATNVPALTSGDLSSLGITPAQAAELYGTGTPMNATSTDRESQDQTQVAPASPESNFSTMLRDPNVASPNSMYAPSAAAQVQTARMAELDPPVDVSSTYFGSPYGDNMASFENPEDQYNMNKAPATDEFGNAIDNRGAVPASPQDVTRQTMSSWKAPETGGGGFTDFLKSNKNLLLPGAALAASALKGNKGPDMSNLENIAAGLNANAGAMTSTANSLIPAVSTGVLPPGADALVNNALKDAQAAIRSKYASMGLTGSTMEQQELSSAANSAAAQRFQVANQLTQTGLQAAGMSTSEMGSAAAIYDAIMKEQLANDNALQTALANFAASAALGAGSSAVKGWFNG